MNLFDLVKRKDRSVHFQGEVTALHRKVMTEARLGVAFAPGSSIKIKNAQEFYCLKAFPRELGWYASTAKKFSSLDFTITLEADKPYKLCHRKSFGLMGRKELILDWPVTAHLSSGFDLVLSNRSQSELFLDVASALNPRTRIVPLLKGNGIEIGPGLNPCIKPSDHVNIHYLESTPVDEWVDLYQKGKSSDSAGLDLLKERYQIGLAHQMEHVRDESLDFIFSNHVFEHLVNPIGVVSIWLKKLKPGGLIAGAIPDCRFTFDARQAPTNRTDWMSEAQKKSFSLERHHYERWCKHTQPKNSPEDLISRNYSVHVHYYTQETFAELASMLADDGLISGYFLNTARNNKDFGFVLQKSMRDENSHTFSASN